jgi:cysteine-rich repeat protein
VRSLALLCLFASGASATPQPPAAAAEAAARAYVAAHPELGVRAEELVAVANRLDGPLRSVGFAQTWHGAPVIGGQIGFVFAHGRVMAVLPHLVAGVRADGDVRGHAILRTTAGDRIVDIHDGARETAYVDATSGAMVERRSKESHATSTLEYDVGLRYATGTRAGVPAPAAAISVDGAATSTDSTGSFAWAGTGAATVVPGVTGTQVAIVDQAGAATASLTAQPGQPTVWSLASDELGDAQLSAFIYVSLAKAHARVIDSGIAAWLDTGLPVYVNEPGACDAASTPIDLHFFRASSACQNTARVADVVFHEFAHVLHHNAVIPGVGMFEQQLSEGLADWFTADLNEDPGIGRGFRYTSAPERDIDPYGRERRWPDDIDDDPHITGLIVSGALWDLRTALVRELGHDAGVAQTQAIFAGILQRAVDIPSSYTAALIADDDDGNLANGTPHFCAIQHAFGIHGLAGPAFAATTVAPPNANGLDLAVAVATPPTGTCAQPQVTSITVTWHVGDGSPSGLALVRQGDTWTGTLPPQPSGSVIAYSIDAALDDGSHVVLPDNPADPEYQLFVGASVPIACATMDTDPGWPQMGNLGNEWEWGPPGRAPSSRDPLVAHTGAAVLGTDLTGDGNYRPNEVTSITMPAVDLTGYERVHLQYWRWLTVEDGTYDRAQIAVNDRMVWHNASSPVGTLDHVDKEWRFHDIDLTSFVADQTASITWSLASDPTKQLGGWTLDDVCVVGLPKTPVCGDGVVDDGEQCDDGNTDDGDGCSSTCQFEIRAGGGGCAAGGSPGSLAALALAYGIRRVRKKSSSSHMHATTGVIDELRQHDLGARVPPQHRLV